MSTHECPTPGCAVMVPFGQLACIEHWRRVPRAMQMELNRWWRHAPGSLGYWEARADCLHALGVPDNEIPGINAGEGREVER